jgi:DNA-binding XRE family transcriptional regulator
MANFLGKRIFELRSKLHLTQDQFGAKYGVSGPAIFKFEKNYVKPSLALWLKIARDCGLEERQAVLLWVKAKLPDQYHDFIEVLPTTEEGIAEQAIRYGQMEGKVDYMRVVDREQLRQAILNDEDIPSGLREIVLDEDFWVVFRPTGPEIHATIQKFGMYRTGKREYFGESLRLIRNFLGNDF